LRSTLKLKVVSVGSTVHFDWPLPTSSDVSLVFVYLRNDPRRGRSVSRTRRGRRSEDLATEARPRGRVWTRRGVAGEGGGGDARVRRLDEVVRVLDVGRLDGEVLDQHGGVSSPVRARGAPGRRRRVDGWVRAEGRRRGRDARARAIGIGRGAARGRESRSQKRRVDERRGTHRWVAVADVPRRVTRSAPPERRRATTASGFPADRARAPVARASAGAFHTPGKAVTFGG
jgi:hypothetical protein